ncbi:MAG: hypothetical protein V7641_1441 [Blastocatellia bacterium]
MSKLKRMLKNRILLTLLAVILGWGSFTVAMTPPAYACPPCQIWYTYYTDETHTEQCGWKVINDTFCGHSTGDGCRTAYYEIEYYCW